MNQRIIRIATRQSPLALCQAEQVRKALATLWPNLRFELLPMRTSGDRFLKGSLSLLGGKGLFVKELEEALLDKRAALAVHSSKDMPAECPKGLKLAIFCKRENPFDALISDRYPNLSALPPKAIVGTASLRRSAQLLAYRPDLCIKPLRGNIQTRLTKLKSQAFQAIILAVAGLERMGLKTAITEILPEDLMLPACGQGALCIESRSDDEETLKLLAPLDDPLSALCVNTERLVSSAFGGSCQVPMAVFCKPLPDNQLRLRAKICSIDGQKLVEDCQQGHEKEASLLAKTCIDALKAKGASQLLMHHES